MDDKPGTVHVRYHVSCRYPNGIPSRILIQSPIKKVACPVLGLGIRPHPDSGLPNIPAQSSESLLRHQVGTRTLKGSREYRKDGLGVSIYTARPAVKKKTLALVLPSVFKHKQQYILVYNKLITLPQSAIGMAPSLSTILPQAPGAVPSKLGLLGIAIGFVSCTCPCACCSHSLTRSDDRSKETRLLLCFVLPSSLVSCQPTAQPSSIRVKTSHS